MNPLPLIVVASLGVVATLWFRLESPRSEKSVVAPGAPYEMVWHEWKLGAVEGAREQGRMVWLSFTAEWDLLSKMNEQRLFSNEEFMAKLAEKKVVLIRADMTVRDTGVEAELKRLGRSSIPANFIFPADPDREMIELPEVLTPDMAMKALEKAHG